MAAIASGRRVAHGSGEADTTMSDEILLTGGNVTQVVRIGDTVRRTPGPWTATVHELLRHLEAVGFQGTPRALGFEDTGREVLSYMEGETGFFGADEVRPPNLWSDKVLVEAAKFLRRFHDATVGFVPPADAVWQLVFPDCDRHEVICHNDFAWYNCVFRDGRLSAAIDFDTAGPAPRVWDVTYAAWRFVPLGAGPIPPSEQGRRLKLFCDAYGLDDREGFVDAIRERIAAARRMVLDGAAAGHPGYQRILAEGGHIEGMEQDLAFVEEQAVEFQRWVDASPT